MGAQMPEDPMNEGGPVEPGVPVKRMAESAEENVEVAPQALPVAARELARREAATDVAAVLASVPVAAPAVVVAASEPEPSKPAAATIRLERKHPLAIRWMHWVNF